MKAQCASSKHIKTGGAGKEEEARERSWEGRCSLQFGKGRSGCCAVVSAGCFPPSVGAPRELVDWLGTFSPFGAVGLQG